MAFRALYRSLLALGVLSLVAVDANAGRRGRVMERSLRFRLHWRSGGRRVAVLAILMRGLRCLFRLRSVMAGVALSGRARVVSFVVELHAAHRSALQDYRPRCRLGRVC